MTHDGGISADTPPRLCKVWVGMPTTGRRMCCLITRLRCSLGLSGLTNLHGAVPLSRRRPTGEVGNDLRPDAFRRFGDDIVDDRAQIAGPFVHRQLSIGAGASAHDLEGVFHLAPTAELVHYVIDEPLEHLGHELAGRLLPHLAEVYQAAVQAEAD